MYLWTVCIGLGGCAAQKPVCSTAKSIPVLNGSIYNELNARTLPPAWGGVIDLIEDPDSPETSKRSRCTVKMDYVPLASGQSTNIANLAFWTADHCLNFSTAQSAELNLFDPDLKIFHRFAIRLPAMEEFKAGLKLFQERSKTTPGGDAASDLAAFQEAGKRNPVSLDNSGTQIIERGSAACQTDTASFKSSSPGLTAICSTVLDLARLEATADSAALNRTDVKGALERLSAYLQSAEKKRFDDAVILVPPIPIPGTTRTLQSDFLFFLNNWRLKIMQMTRWRGLESQSSLIEKVRNCAADETEGICAAPFRTFFNDALSEYAGWNVSSKTYPVALHDEVNAPETPTKHNLPWIIKGQNDIKNFAFLSAESSFASNFLRKGVTATVSSTLPVLGESGALFFGLATPFQMIGADSNTDPTSIIKFYAKTVLIPYATTSNAGLSFLLQPGDSGSVWIVNNTPIGVVATVDGVETSGGASVRPLPEIPEDDAASPETQTTTTARKKTGNQPLCL
jgi:hypothetical protein